MCRTKINGFWAMPKICWFGPATTFKTQCLICVGNSCTLMKVWSITAWACGTCETKICEWVHWLVGSKYGDIRWSSFAVTSTYWKIIFRKNIRLYYFVVIILFPRTVRVGYFFFWIYCTIIYFKEIDRLNYTHIPNFVLS